MVGGSPAGGVLPEPAAGAVLEPDDGAVVAVDPDELVEELVAAEAMPAAPTLVPATTAPVTSARRILLGLVDMVVLPFGCAREDPGSPPPCETDLNRSCARPARFM
jgi:hypothetical protein